MARARRTPSRAIVREDHFVEALDPGIRLHLREKRRRGRGRAAGALLFVHGQSIPSPAGFDLPVPGYSWMDYAAARGFDVFALSLRGYGASTRPPVFAQDPRGKPPAVRGRTGVRDIEAAVRFICERRGVDRLSLLGWTQGTMMTAAFAAAHPARVERLILFAPLYLNESPEARALFRDPKRPRRLNPDFFCAWRWVNEKGQQRNWSRLIPRGKRGLWREERVVRAYWREQIRYDPEGRRRRVPAVRVPNGLMADHYDRTRGKSIFDPARVRCPALLIRGEHDLVSPPAEAERLYGALTKSPGKRYVVLGDASHFVQFEKRREDLFGEVQHFLEG
ncbi:MAG: alpha/beta fold hydrolase [bacterium]